MTARPAQSSERRAPIPVTVLSGALGAGKTTLLNAALRGVLTNVAVVVNEFGDIGIDNELIEAASEDVVLLPGGCVCCQVRADLAVALLQLERGAALGEHPGFERVIVETSGLAEPGPILQLFAESPALTGRFRLDALVTVVDAQFGVAALADESPAYKQALLPQTRERKGRRERGAARCCAFLRARCERGEIVLAAQRRRTAKTLTHAVE